MRRAPALEQFAGQASWAGRRVSLARPVSSRSRADRRGPRRRSRRASHACAISSTERNAPSPFGAAVWCRRRRRWLPPILRDPGEDGSVVPGTLRMEHCWLIPRDTGDPRVDELLRRIDEEGMRVVDPRGVEGRAPHHCLAPTDSRFERLEIDYGRLHERVRRRPQRARGGRGTRAERLGAAPAWDASDDWIVVDGRLRSPSRARSGWSSSSATRISPGRKRRRCSVCRRDTARRHFCRPTIAVAVGRSRAAHALVHPALGRGWDGCATRVGGSRRRALFAPPRRSTASPAGFSPNGRPGNRRQSLGDAALSGASPGADSQATTRRRHPRLAGSLTDDTRWWRSAEAGMTVSIQIFEDLLPNGTEHADSAA